MRTQIYMAVVLVAGSLLMAPSCKKPREGCRDVHAENYDDLAEVDDGSCRILGCTDPQSPNYNPEANVDDGTCYRCNCPDTRDINYKKAGKVACLDENTCNADATLDPFVGKYTMYETCNFDEGSKQYILTISKADVANYQMKLENVGGDCFNNLTVYVTMSPYGDHGLYGSPDISSMGAVGLWLDGGTLRLGYDTQLDTECAYRWSLPGCAIAGCGGYGIKIQ